MVRLRLVAPVSFFVLIKMGKNDRTITVDLHRLKVCADARSSTQKEEDIIRLPSHHHHQKIKGFVRSCTQMNQAHVLIIIFVLPPHAPHGL